MQFRIRIFRKVYLYIYLLDLDPTDGNVGIGISLSWKGDLESKKK